MELILKTVIKTLSENTNLNKEDIEALAKKIILDLRDNDWV